MSCSQRALQCNWCLVEGAAAPLVEVLCRGYIGNQSLEHNQHNPGSVTNSKLPAAERRLLPARHCSCVSSHQQVRYSLHSSCVSSHPQVRYSLHSSCVSSYQQVRYSLHSSCVSSYQQFRYSLQASFMSV